MIIYKVTNKINNKVYIGQTTLSLDERRRYHYKESRRKNDTTYFHNALNKYHYEDFVWEILEDNIDNIDTLNEKEIYYISKYNSTDRNVGYNLKAGGNGGGINSDFTKKKIGITTKEKWKNPEIAKKMLEGLKKGTETSKKQALTNFKQTTCKYCNKEFTYRPIDTYHIIPKFCSKECLSLFRKNCNTGLTAANNINKIKHQKQDTNVIHNIQLWLKDNGYKLQNIKYNKLQDIFNELKAITSLQDERSIMRPFNINSRKLFIKELSKMYAELYGNI